MLQEKPQLFDKEVFLPLDPTQELIFPPELIVSRMQRSVFEAGKDTKYIKIPLLSIADGRIWEPTDTHFSWGEGELGVSCLFGGAGPAQDQ